MKQRKQRRDKIARLISWGHWFTFFNILLVLAIGTLYIEASAAPGSALGVIYLIVNWLGHFAFLPFIVFIILIFPFCIFIPISRVLRGIATLVASFGLIALVADALFYRQYGYHLNTYSLSQLASDAESAFAGASFLILLGMLLIFVVLLVFELGLSNIAWKRLDSLQQKHWGPTFASIFVACFLASHSIHVWADAVFYTPITKQDDMFPLSYPTTAKTLMSKHGLLVEERQAITQNLIRTRADINLQYPLNELMCSRQSNPNDTLLIAVDKLTSSQAAKLMELSSSPVKAASLREFSSVATPVLGQTHVSAALFELTYGLPDLYQRAVQQANTPPAYLTVLESYGIELRADDEFALADITSNNPNASLELLYYRQGQWAELVAQVKIALTEVQNQQLQLIIVGLTPAVSSGTETYAINNLQVPLLISSNLSWQAQPLVLLSDIMPSVLHSYMRCANEAASYSVGVNMTEKVRKLPLMTSYGTDLVIYQEQMTSVIEADANIRTFANDTYEPLSGVVPATPILVDGIRKLKRFSNNNTAAID
ncbi:DUF3413 domain-containing protein [Pseudidiomarina sp. GXY010]|uniref:DUF3413 domain-containing protein n=1 Tax=Pseudidiomarina fusca TaxID=2965078 RepID=A0ABU3KU07_9GAMM|nr:DUF3413 domain-containing protein [Pseudidiomarina sp. GXY010]MDT7524984.1 DUF3413 domain-containing protein [Pseudidiomarina sp. GXY010]